MEELLFHGFEVLSVRQDSRDYELTMTHWARRFDERAAALPSRWSEEIYRAFRVFLWGGVYGFRTNRLQAYSLVAERRADAGPTTGQPPPPRSFSRLGRQPLRRLIPREHRSGRR